MSLGQENALGRAASSYLRSAKLQPVEWMEWGAEAFARAEREGKPVLLDIGAVWCHWCHVMDHESYEDGATAAVINEHFVAVKVDRDERPDVDTRYQAAVAAISGQGGWPLTAFLTPEGKPYFGGGYFPPEDRYGRPSFQRVLLTMAEAFYKRRDEVEESAGSVMAAIEESESFAGRGGEAGAELVEKLVASMVSQFDERHGGFGSQPKFPHCGAIDLLLDTASRGGPLAERARTVAVVTLRKMAAGGVHDQLAGGFHRYSTDERWVVPHFEKMAYDNSELLKNYVHAYQTTGEAEFARVAIGIVRWMDEWLSDRERGGFYASQDADVSPAAGASMKDDGDYFTWTRAEARAVLTADEFAIVVAHFSINEVGDMHHDTAKNVLRVETVVAPEQRELLESARRKLYAARLERRTPYVDKTLYTGWNGMCISAYLAAGRGLELGATVEFALWSLDRVLAEAWSADAGLAHVVAYGEDVAAGTKVAGVLEDYAFVVNACLDAWEATGGMRYYEAARDIAEAMIARFHDAAGGGFFDTEQGVGAAEKIGALSARRKPLQDAPSPAGNSVAAMVLLRLEALNGDGAFGAMARGTLETFAGVVEHFGLYAASYGLALVRAVHGPLQVCVVGEDNRARELEAAGLVRFAANKGVVRVGRGVAETPPALIGMLSALPQSESGFALVCRGTTCLPPVRDVEALVDAVQGSGVLRS